MKNRADLWTKHRFFAIFKEEELDKIDVLWFFDVTVNNIYY
jgi:hypothetical protein